MNKLISTILLLTVSLGCLPVFGQVILDSGPDQYIGGQATHTSYNNTDVIGDADVFDLTRWEISTPSLGSSTLIVEIQGNYFDDILNQSNGLLDTSLGDLFISTNGLAWGAGDDTNLDYIGGTTETSWDYVITVDPRSGGGVPTTETQTTGYRVSDGTIVSSQVDSGIFRENQEWSFTPDNGASVAFLADWYVSTDSISFSFDLGPDGIPFSEIGPNGLGFHWTMECGNDVIEFALDPTVTPVPEPSQIGALGIVGMGAFMVLRRRLRRRSAARAS